MGIPRKAISEGQACRCTKETRSQAALASWGSVLRCTSVQERETRQLARFRRLLSRLLLVLVPDADVDQPRPQRPNGLFGGWPGTCGTTRNRSRRLFGRDGEPLLVLILTDKLHTIPSETTPHNA